MNYSIFKVIFCNIILHPEFYCEITACTVIKQEITVKINNNNKSKSTRKTVGQQ